MKSLTRTKRRPSRGTSNNLPSYTILTVISRRFTEIPETTPAASLRKSLPTLDAKPKVKPDAKPSVPSAAASKPAAAPAPSQKRKAEEIESPAPQPAATGATGTAAAEGMSKSQRKKLAKKAKLEPEGAGGGGESCGRGGIEAGCDSRGSETCWCDGWRSEASEGEALRSLLHVHPMHTIIQTLGSPKLNNIYRWLTRTRRSSFHPA